MSLSNTQYNEILSEYKERQLESSRMISLRYKEVCQKIPSYRLTEEEIVSLSAEMARAKIRKDEPKIKEIDERLEELRLKQKLSLTDAGFSINYLEPVYQCSLCKDTGFIDGNRCSCLKMRIIEKMFEQSSIREMLANDNFENMQTDLQVGEAGRQFDKAAGKAKKFVENFGKAYSNLCFSGTVGTGKTFLSNCIFGELLKQGYSYVYFSAPTLFSELADYKFRRTNNDLNPLEILHSCDLLVIDDLGTEITNSFTASELLTLLNERHKSRKSTIISTNLSLEELCERYSERVFSRLFSNFDICTLSGQDIRLYLKQMQNRK
ncbi:MAG: ATP-binding protein [Lachnospiraceae bacterium]|nr:ATP-binding protein [Lachnospiraceae bacterium]